MQTLTFAGDSNSGPIDVDRWTDRTSDGYILQRDVAWDEQRPNKEEADILTDGGYLCEDLVGRHRYAGVENKLQQPRPYPEFSQTQTLKKGQDT